MTSPFGYGRQAPSADKRKKVSKSAKNFCQTVKSSGDDFNIYMKLRIVFII